MYVYALFCGPTYYQLGQSYFLYSLAKKENQFNNALLWYCCSRVQSLTIVNVLSYITLLPLE